MTEELKPCPNADIPKDFERHNGTGQPHGLGDVQATYRRDPMTAYRLMIPAMEDWAWAHREPRELDIVSYRTTRTPIEGDSR